MTAKLALIEIVRKYKIVQTEETEVCGVDVCAREGTNNMHCCTPSRDHHHMVYLIPTTGALVQEIWYHYVTKERCVCQNRSPLLGYRL